MSRWLLASFVVLALLFGRGLSPAAVAAVEVRVRKESGELPKPAAVAFASGSGAIVGKRLVLTNRHIVQDDKKSLFDGFRIYTSPDYKKAVSGKVIATCENYDLALIETSSDLPFNGISVLDDLPPLAARVTAYGFPLGSRFGVALTTTGGQVSRHPVRGTAGSGSQDAEVRTALWHDAILTSGNSGGPLFTDTSRILVGVNFAYLNTGGKHAMAVPADAVAEFLRKANATSGVTFTKSLDGESASVDPQAMTVFIESMVGDITKRAPDLAAANSLNELIVAKLKARLPVLTPSALKRVEGGELHLAFPPVKVTSVEAGDIVRLQGDTDIRSLDDDSMIAVVDDVICVMLLPPSEALALQTKLAKNAKDKVALDQAYFVGPPVPVRTTRGTVFALVFMPLNGFSESDEFKQLVAEEKTRREAGSTAVAAGASGAVTVSDRDAKSIANYESRLRRTFSDLSGKFRVDAVIVKIGPTDVELIRMDNKQKLTVPAARLSADDRQWMRDNERLVSMYGPRLATFYAGAAVVAPAATKSDR